MGVAAVAVDAAHDTLIVAEKEDGETGYGVDEDQESPLLELAGYVVACDIVHGRCCWPVGLNVEQRGSDDRTRGLYVALREGVMGGRLRGEVRRQSESKGKKGDRRDLGIWGLDFIDGSWKQLRYQGTRICRARDAGPSVSRQLHMQAHRLIS